MPYITCKLIFLFFLLFQASRFWKLPDLPPKEEYGNLLIDRISSKNNVKPVVFSHWIHRQKYTCRVCHFELEFNLKLNTTEITEKECREGKFCGNCHNGKISFSHEEPNCIKCHNGDLSFGKEKFEKLKNFKKTKYGNCVDWQDALQNKLIEPKNYLSIKPMEEMKMEKTLYLEAEFKNIPPAVFSHKAHNLWLDCNMCHPEIFNIQRKTTKHFYMVNILRGEFCGVCHLNVAFPIHDCKSCHPKIKK